MEGDMKSPRNLGLGVGVVILIFSILACSSPAELFSTSTPLPSNTPTDTMTPSPTATLVPTSTPVPPVSLIGCASQDCPSSKYISDYTGNAQIQPNVTTTVSIPYTDAVHLFTGWCAKTKSDLSTSLPGIQFFFTIDDVSYLDQLKEEYYDAPDPQDSSITESCYGMGAVASGWIVGQSHLVKIGITISMDTSDGWDNYPAGTTYPYFYLIVPSEPATATPLPSPTLTPLPLPPIATSKPPAPSVSCQINSNIIIQNRSGSPLTLYLTGTGSFTFNLGSGDYSTVKVCSGSYNYTVYGTCNGSPANGSGRISDGDQVYFACK